MKSTALLLHHAPQCRHQPRRTGAALATFRGGTSALRQSWINDITAVYCSTEKKAVDGAHVLANHLSLTPVEIEALGENDRSATGYLPAEEFEAVADHFFAQPTMSVRGWQRAVDAQTRSVRAITAMARTDALTVAIAIVSHGAASTLLYCQLSRQNISRQRDQPANGGGNYYRFLLASNQVDSWWKVIDDVVILCISFTTKRSQYRG